MWSFPGGWTFAIWIPRFQWIPGNVVFCHKSPMQFETCGTILHAPNITRWSGKDLNKCSFSCNNRFLLRSHTKKESFPTWSRAPESEDKTRRTNRVELGQLASTLTFSEPPHPALGAPWCSWHLCVLLGCYSTSALVGYPPPSQNHTLRTNACRTLKRKLQGRETQRHDLTIQQPNENLSTSEHG